MSDKVGADGGCCGCVMVILGLCVAVCAVAGTIKLCQWLFPLTFGG